MTYLLSFFMKTINFFWCLLNLLEVSFLWIFSPNSYDLQSTDSTFLASRKLNTSIHWPWYGTVHVYATVIFLLICIWGPGPL
jgi:hypothetical protein